MRLLVPILGYCIVQGSYLVRAFQQPARVWFSSNRRVFALVPTSRNEVSLRREKSRTRDAKRDSSLHQTLPEVYSGDEGYSFGGGTDWTVTKDDCNDEESQGRWERLWAEGEKEKLEAGGFLNSMAITDGSMSALGAGVAIAMPVEVVSFDLDNTLWATKGVIQAANDALQDHLQREHPALVEKCVIPDLMKEIWKERLAANPEMDKSPVNLTELRKAGLTRACELTGTDPSTVVESSFAVWRRERHNVEPYLFPGVLETLTALKERGIRLIAITNGNADTDDIPCLKDLFEFCVMAEQVGERKPESGPFRAAIMRAGFSSEEHVGGQWVHVGDEWSTDCVGAKAMRMRTILVPVPGSGKLEDRDEPVALDVEEQEKAEEEEEDRERIAARIGEVGGAKVDHAVSSIAGTRWEKWKTLDGLGLTVECVVDGANVPPLGIEMPQSLKDAVAARDSKKTNMISTNDNKIEYYAAAQGTRSTRMVSKEEFVASLTSSEQISADSIKGVVWEARVPDGPSYHETVAGGAQGEIITSMGSGSYLADMLMKDFMDVEAERISDVIAIVDEWNQQFEARLASKPPAAAPAAPPVQSEDTGSIGADGEGMRAGESKFCIGCGIKIPKVARFCPDCGVRQETVAAL